jgi:hypothetical protein
MRVSRARGRLERKFWERAGRLKERPAACAASVSGVQQKLRLALARRAVRAANRAYLAGDLREAVAGQEHALRIFRRMEK